MRPDLMEILACPVCKGELTLTVAREDAGEVIEGSLYCAACDETYPITEGIPNLLPPDLRRAMEAEGAPAAPAHGSHE
ncbi:MAG: Trm112 family protein [Dehalococcoidia bacterium]|nr:Trm112 family protein [Dehalococcoidia bacterium]